MVKVISIVGIVAVEMVVARMIVDVVALVEDERVISTPLRCSHCGLDNITQETCCDLAGRPHRFANVVNSVTSDSVDPSSFT